MFVKGQSGNPGGRPRGYAHYIRKQAGEHLEVYVDRLHAIATGRNDKQAMEAIRFLVPYVWGRPVETVVSINPDNLRDLSDEDLQAALRVAERLTGG